MRVGDVGTRKRPPFSFARTRAHTRDRPGSGYPSPVDAVIVVGLVGDGLPHPLGGGREYAPRIVLGEELDG